LFFVIKSRIKIAVLRFCDQNLKNFSASNLASDKVFGLIGGMIADCPPTTGCVGFALDISDKKSRIISSLIVLSM
jgi:hypothetical protein